MKNWIKQLEDIIEEQLKEDSSQSITYDKILDICDEIDIDYLAYKKIEPQIKGCLDREREKDQRIAVLEKALELACYELKCPYQQLDNTKVHTLFNFYKDGEEINLIDYFKKQAEKELGDKE